MPESVERRQPAPFTSEQQEEFMKQVFYRGDPRGVQRIIKGVNRVPIMESFRGDPRLN